MDFALPASAPGLRRLADAFVAEHLRPLEADLPPAEGPLPPAIRRALDDRRRELGLWGLSVPAELGGMGLTWLEAALVQERLQRSPLGMWGQDLLAAGDPPPALLPDPALLRGERVAHQLLVVAPRSGRPGLRAVPTPGGARLQGEWPAVPAHLARDLLLVVAPLQGRPQGLLCGPGLPGFHLARRRPGMGSVELVDLVWEDCHCPAERILPDAGAGAGLVQARAQVTALAAGALGAAEQCLERALEQLRTRQTFGRVLADRQSMQWMLADSARELQAARLLVYRAAAAADSGETGVACTLAGPVKAYATDAACRIADRVLQMHGGYGYSRDLPLERCWRELRFYRLALGSNDELIAASADALLAALT